MKAKDLAEELLKHPEFDVQFVFSDTTETFPNIRSFNITGIADVGHSGKVILLDGEEDS